MTPENSDAVLFDAREDGVASREQDDISCIRPLENRREHCVPKFG